MTAALIFTVREPIDVVIQRCRQTITVLGAPLKSDSGHFITGVVTSGHNNVEVRVTWLVENAGTQITVSASHEDVSEAELDNVTQRFKHQYCQLAAIPPKTPHKPTMSSILVVAGAIAAIALFVLAFIKLRS